MCELPNLNLFLEGGYEEPDLLTDASLEPWSSIGWRLRIERAKRAGLVDAAGILFLDWQALSGFAPWQMNDPQLMAFFTQNGMSQKNLDTAIRHARLVKHSYPKHHLLALSTLPNNCQSIVLSHLEKQIKHSIPIHPIRLNRIVQLSEREHLISQVKGYFDAPTDTIQCSLSEVCGFPALHFYKKHPNAKGHAHQVWLSPYNTLEAPNKAALKLSRVSWCNQYEAEYSRLLNLRLNLCSQLKKAESILDFYASSQRNTPFLWLTLVINSAPFQAVHLIELAQDYWDQLIKYEKVTEQSLNLASLRHVEVRISSAVTELIDLLQQGYLASRKVEATRKALRILDIALHCDLAKGNPEIAVKLLRPQINAFDGLVEALRSTPALLTGMRLTQEDVQQMYIAYCR